MWPAMGQATNHLERIVRLDFHFPSSVDMAVRCQKVARFMQILIDKSVVPAVASTIELNIETGNDENRIKIFVSDLPGGDKTIAAAKKTWAASIGSEHELCIKNKTTDKVIECKRFAAQQH